MLLYLHFSPEALAILYDPKKYAYNYLFVWHFDLKTVS